VNQLLVIGQYLRPYFPHLAAVISAVMFGLGVGYIKVSTLPPEIDVNDNWTLPQWGPYQPSLPSRELAALELWGEDDRAREIAETPEPRDASAWEFIGITQDGETRLAIIELGQDRKLQRLNSGDRLPNGVEILSVGANELTLSDEGTQVTIKLFDTEEN